MSSEARIGQGIDKLADARGEAPKPI